MLCPQIKNPIDLMDSCQAVQSETWEFTACLQSFQIWTWSCSKHMDLQGEALVWVHGCLPSAWLAVAAWFSVSSAMPEEFCWLLCSAASLQWLCSGSPAPGPGAQQSPALSAAPASITRAVGGHCCPGDVEMALL